MPQQSPFAPPIARALWRINTEQLPRWQAKGVTALRTLYALARDLADGPMPLYASSLVYTTLLSLVPLLAFSFSILKGFGAHSQLEPLIYDALEPLGPSSQEVARKLISFVDNVQVGVLGSVGLVLLVYTAVSTMQKLELAFNQIWRVGTFRPLPRRIAYYISILVIAPIFILAAIGLTATLVSRPEVQMLATIPVIGHVVQFLLTNAPKLLVIIAFCIVYCVLPNAAVSPRSAAVGAIIAGVIWFLASWAFRNFVAQSGSYDAIYSAFAGAILFIFWLYVNWIILLLGAAIAYYHQYPGSLALPMGAAGVSIRTQERLGLTIVRVLGDAYRQGRIGLSLDEILNRVKLPRDVVVPVIDRLIAGGIITGAGTGASKMIPARPVDRILVKDVLDCVRRPNAIVSVDVADSGTEIKDIEDRIDAAVSEAIADATVSDLMPPEASLPEKKDVSGRSGVRIPRETPPSPPER